MVRIFSKLRKSLLSEGKSLRYIKYALGEIALVMIGILLALQVNNWNEQKKNRTFEREILSLLDQNLMKDSVLISIELINAKKRIKEGGRFVLSQLYHQLSQPKPL